MASAFTVERMPATESPGTRATIADELSTGWADGSARAELHYVSGKGGTGKTTVATALVLGRHRRDRLEQIVAARAELGREASAEAITRHIYRDVSPFLLMVAEQSTLVALRHLDRLDAPDA